MKFKFDMNKATEIKHAFYRDMIMVALLSVLAALSYVALSIFNVSLLFLLFSISIYFSLRTLTHLLEDFYPAYVLFTARAGVFFSWAVWLLFVMADKHSLTKCSRSISMSTT